MKGTQISVDPASVVPPFEQIRAQVAARIASGDLVPGTRLPTVRGLAAVLGLAANTVARSYRELEHAGLVETHGRSGTLVSAAGNVSRENAQRAAREYVIATRALGLDGEQALAFVRAAVDAQVAHS